MFKLTHTNQIKNIIRDSVTIDYRSLKFEQEKPLKKARLRCRLSSEIGRQSGYSYCLLIPFPVS